MNTPVREGETIEGSRTMRNRPYQVLKCSTHQQLFRKFERACVAAQSLPEARANALNRAKHVRAMLMSATIFAMLITPHDRSIRAASGECHESKAPARWSSNGNSTALRPPPHWSTFEGGGLVLMFWYRCLFYRRIWKGGNNAIRQSIMSAPGLMVRTTDTELVADTMLTCKK